MIWNSLGDFLAMGGYGPYVWGSFVVVLAALGVEQLILALHREDAEVAAGIEAVRRRGVR